MLTIVPHNHRYWLEEGGRWEFFWISMSGQEAVRIHRVIQATAGPVLRLRPETIEHLAELLPAPDRRRGRDAGHRLRHRLRSGDGALRRGLRLAWRGASDGEDDRDPPGGRAYPRQSRQAAARYPSLPRSPASAARIFRACSPRAKALRRRSSCCSERMRRAARLLTSHALPPGQGDRHPLRLRGAELFRQSLPPLLRRQPDGVPHDGNVCRDRRGAL